MRYEALLKEALNETRRAADAACVAGVLALAVRMSASNKSSYHALNRACQASHDAAVAAYWHRRTMDAAWRVAILAATAEDGDEHVDKMTLALERAREAATLACKVVEAMQESVKAVKTKGGR